MAYPTDVTKPRFGFEAFAENDPESQLAQAAFLLLLGTRIETPTPSRPISGTGAPVPK
jgi:hypothetical protein